MEVPFWSLVLVTLLAFVRTASTSEARVVCYYANWSVYRPGTAKFSPQNINPYLCTHLIYAFGGFTKENQLKPFDKYQDIEKGGYAKFTGLKTYNKRLKVLLAIGGWNEGSARFSPMVASKERRREFVRNAIKFLRQNNFDGLDLDWEYPAYRDGGKPKDRENYAKLVKELREEFEKESEKTGKPRLMLTMAVPAGFEYLQKGYDVKTLNKYLDFMNVLMYDFHSAYEPSVNHHAPLYPLEEPNEYSYDDQLNIDAVVRNFIEHGADRDKLVIGIPTYGRSYTLFNPDSTDMGAPADGPGEQGDATREKGYLAYHEICESVMEKPRKARKSTDSDDEEDSDLDSDDEDDAPWTVVKMKPEAMGPYAFKGNQWVGYDDPDIARRKAEYVAEHGLGGIMFWTLDTDDFRGTCHGKPYPLIEAAKEALLSKIGTTKNAVIAHVKSKPSSTARPVQSSTPTWSIQTPEPPTTPDPGSDFKCTDEGFFQHPRDCKKYFWCLDSGPSGLGIVPHQFTCPSGLFFNKAADSCDFARNVPCKKAPTTTKKTIAEAPAKVTSTSTTTSTTPKPSTTSRSRLTSKSSVYFRTTTTTSTTTTTPEPIEDVIIEGDIDPAEVYSEEDPKVLKELIDLIKKLGGVEQLEKHLGLTDDIPNKHRIHTVLQARKENKHSFIDRLNKVNINEPTSETVVIPSQNSRVAPQYSGTGEEVTRLERPRYTTINRSRPTAAASENVPEAESLSVRPLPQYVNIRRARPGATQSDNEEDERNALFERNIQDTKEPENNLPRYVTISRHRTEAPIPESSSERYETISRESPIKEEFDNSEAGIPNYVTLVRTTSAPSTLTVQLSSILNSPTTTTTSEEPTTLVSSSAPETSSPSTTPETTTSTKAPTTERVVSRRPIIQRRGRPTTQSTTTTTTSTATSVIGQAAEKRRNFLRRSRPTSTSTTTTAAPEVQNSTEPAPASSSTAQPSPTPLSGRFNFRTRNKFEKKPFVRPEISSTQKSAGNESVVTRRPSLENGGKTSTEAKRPSRNFVRRRYGGINAASSSTTTTIEPPTTSTRTIESSSPRRGFRLGSRRRTTAAITTPPTTTTTSTPEVSTVTSPLVTTEISTHLTSVSYEEPSTAVFDQSEPAEVTPRRVPSSGEVEDQNPLPSNEEKTREGKRFSSSFRLNQLDDLKKKSEEDEDSTSTEALEEFTSDTAVALAAHKLLEAPLPSTPNYDEDYTTINTHPPSKRDKTTTKSYFGTTNTFFETTFPDSTGSQKAVTTTFETSFPSTGFSHEDSYSKINHFLDTTGKYLSVPIDDYGFSTASYPGVDNEPAYFTREYLLESPVTRGYDHEYQYLSTVNNAVTETAKPAVTSRRRISTTLRPSTAIPHLPRRIPNEKAKPFEKVVSGEVNKKASFKPIQNYDYYDEGNEKVFQSYTNGNKVIVHGKGNIECLDQGNFPHPTSCKKFISCARMDRGGMFGWEYTCPKGLSYDPVGGICNWSIGLGCREE